MGQAAISMENTIKPELLAAEIKGEVADDDYFARSMKVLESFEIDDPTNGHFDHAAGIDLVDAHVLQNPGYQQLEHGYVRLPDGSYYIAVLTDLGMDVNGEMLDWWFRNCENTEQYKWWHPQDHISGTWDPQFYSVMPHERKPGHYIDHIHIVEEKINGIPQNVQIEFYRPSKHFDTTRFAEDRVTACICARIYVRDPTLGLMAVGHLMHMVREADGRSELRSRFWLGDMSYPETVDNLIFARLINYFVSFKLTKMIKIPTSTARGVWIHCAQEMQCLREFLPHLYAASKQKETNRIMGGGNQLIDIMNS